MANEMTTVANNLTAEERAKIARITSSVSFGMFKAGAVALNGLGFGLDKSTSFIGGALHMAGDAVEKTGEVTSKACYSGAAVLQRKAEENDLSGISDEDLIKAFEAEEGGVAV